MSLDVKVPAAGESITSANVARWHKANGDAVRKGEVLVTLETDKVSNELEAASDGVLQILVGEGEEVSIGTLIARIADVIIPVFLIVAIGFLTNAIVVFSVWRALKPIDLRCGMDRLLVLVQDRKSTRLNSSHT